MTVLNTVCKANGCSQPPMAGQVYCSPACAPYGKLGREFDDDEPIESRTCACGCGASFRVMKRSPQRYASLACEGNAGRLGTRSAGRKARVRPIPASASGIVSSGELAKLLGVSYGTIFLWTKSGKLTPVPSEGRNKQFDVAQVRAQLGGGTSQNVNSEPEEQDDEDLELEERIAAAGPAPEPMDDEEELPEEDETEEDETEEEPEEEAEEETGEEAEEDADANQACALKLIDRARTHQKAGRAEVALELLWVALDLVGLGVDA